jgi:hypothetical protein
MKKILFLALVLLAFASLAFAYPHALYPPPPLDPWGGNGVGPNCSVEGARQSTHAQCSIIHYSGLIVDGWYQINWICQNGRWSVESEGTCN